MEEPTPTTGSVPATGPIQDEAASIQKIKDLLRSKDDTQRFVGLALLKTVLDNSPTLRDDQDTIQELWAVLPVKFLDRLLRTGAAKPSNENSKGMLDISVTVLHTFAALLPEESRGSARFTQRIPVLVTSLLHSSQETTHLLLQLLQSLVSSPEGAAALVKVEDITPLIEIAPTYDAALDVLSFAWLNSMVNDGLQESLREQVEVALDSLSSTFKGTDAVTYLEFIGSFLRRADPKIVPSNPKWLKTTTSYIQNLVGSRPNAKARAAYTNAAAALLQTYPLEAPSILFAEKQSDEKPFGYLFLNLLLIDIRSSAPTLLQQLNSPEYAQTSRRLASAFDTISIFIAFLVRSLDDESLDTMVMSPDSLLKLRKGVSETMSVTAEYLRDRWDASVSGAMGLHPDARSGTAATSAGSHYTLAWDSMKDNADGDPMIQSAVRALALWLREEEDSMLRKEATGLTDMFLDLYKSSCESEKLDFRSPVLVAFEGLMGVKKGRNMFFEQGGWTVLVRDMTSILSEVLASDREAEAAAMRGSEIVRVLLSALENTESGNTAENQMDLITNVAAWGYDGQEQSVVIQEFEVGVMTLCSAVLAGADPAMRRRYTHSIHAVRGLAVQLKARIGEDKGLLEEMNDVLEVLDTMMPTRRE